tara:strand:+ start:142 stop:348 length:207 start_codon:yes stop_codon:yes gene_type:complete
MAVALLIILSTLFMVDNKEFIDQAIKEMKDGAEWHYVGPQSLDPTAKSIPAQVEGEEPYIIWKLKKPE